MRHMTLKRCIVDRAHIVNDVMAEPTMLDIREGSSADETRCKMGEPVSLRLKGSELD